MKRFALFAVLGLGMLLPSLAAAQEQTYDHGEVGVFADYMRLSRPDPAINFIGVGGRVAFNVHPNVALEAEMAYDFKRNTTSVFDNGLTTSFVTTRLRPLTALFGPKFQAGTSGPFRAFVTGKVGFVNFTNTSNLSTAAFGNQVGGITDGDTKFAVYPGAGIEGFWGPVGLRLEVGDEIYFAGGAQNNLKVSFGPHFRF
jgi:opacity protein-like surface antigen